MLINDSIELHVIQYLLIICTYFNVMQTILSVHYLIQCLIDFVQKFYLKLDIKLNGFILNEHLWNVFFLPQIIQIYLIFIYIILTSKQLDLSLMVRNFLRLISLTKKLIIEK